MKYSLQGIETPMGVADYKIAKALPKELKSEIPSVKELERALDSKAENIKTSFEKELEKLKPLLVNIEVAKSGKRNKKITIEKV